MLKITVIVLNIWRILKFKLFRGNVCGLTALQEI